VPRLRGLKILQEEMAAPVGRRWFDSTCTRNCACVRLERESESTLAPRRGRCAVSRIAPAMWSVDAVSLVGAEW
jgi:hypothetical protein